MADNCSSLETWSFHSAFTDFSEDFSHETETLTRALQMSLSADADVLAAVVASAAGGGPPFLVKPDPAASHSASDAEAAPKRVRNPALGPAAGKMSKRKSRASKRSTTTYITADPANFRQMVQQVTGIRFAGAHEDAVLRPEPQRPGGAGAGAARVSPLQGSCLPTLDTSSFLLDRAAWTPAPSPPSHGSSFGSPASEPAAVFELEARFPCFPTLESWGVM